MARQVEGGLPPTKRNASKTFSGNGLASTRSRFAAYYFALRRYLLPCMLLLVLLSCAWAGYSGYRLYQAVSYNRQLASSKPSARPELHAMFNDAWRLVQRGLSLQALALYAKVADGEDDTLAASASYNSGNLYLSQAQQLLEDQGLAAWDSVSPLLSLAKLSYQRALKLRPQWVEAKYNLELALRLAPNIQSSKQKVQDDEQEDVGERPTGWPSIPGFPRGMP